MQKTERGRSGLFLIIQQEIELVSPEVKECLRNTTVTDVGKYQLHNQGRIYCTRKEYCPLQEDMGDHLKRCAEKEYK